MAGSSISTSLGRFFAGAFALGGAAAAEPVLTSAAGTVAAATGVALTGPAAIGILGVLAAFAGGAAIVRGAGGQRHDEQTAAIQAWLERQARQELSLAKAMAGLPDDAPFEHADVCNRLRTIREVFTGDLDSVAVRLTKHPDFARHVQMEMEKREAADGEFRMAISGLVNLAIEQKRISVVQVRLLEGIDDKLAEVIEGQQQQNRKIDQIVDYYIVQLNQKDAELRQRQEEIDSLRAQLRSAIEANVKDAQATGRSVDDLLEELRRGDPTKLLEFLDRQVDGYAPLLERDRERAAVAYVVGDTVRAEESLRRILALRPDDPDAINQLGLVLRSRGDCDQAIRCFECLLKIGGGDRRWAVVAFGNLGGIHQLRGESRLAESAYSRALALSQELNYTEGAALALIGLSYASSERGEFDAAESMLLRSIVMHESRKNRRGAASAYLAIGTLQGQAGDHDKAKSWKWKALEAYSAIGDQRGIAAALASIGATCRDRGILYSLKDLFQEHWSTLTAAERANGTPPDILLRFASENGYEEARANWMKAHDIYLRLGELPLAERVKISLDHLPPA